MKKIVSMLLICALIMMAFTACAPEAGGDSGAALQPSSQPAADPAAQSQGNGGAPDPDPVPPDPSIDPEIGAIVMSNGVIKSVEQYQAYTGDAFAVGIVCMVNTEGTGGLMLGVYNTHSGPNCGARLWTLSQNGTGSYIKYTDIQGTQDGGDTDGFDNWSRVGGSDNNFPVFKYANTYGQDTVDLTGTIFETGWYVPTIYELYHYIWTNYTTLNLRLASVNGTPIANNTYWSSSQVDISSSTVRYIDFKDGYVGSYNKWNYKNVCVLHRFTVE